LHIDIGYLLTSSTTRKCAWNLPLAIEKKGVSLITSAGVEGLDKAQLCHTQRGQKKCGLNFNHKWGQRQNGWFIMENLI
jgi:hypothetical protein